MTPWPAAEDSSGDGGATEMVGAESGIRGRSAGGDVCVWMDGWVNAQMI